ncbi:MAG: protein translocase subunit SecD, partial [bacterium]
MSKLRVKIILILSVIGISFFFLYPTIQWYMLTPQERKTKERVRDKMIEKTLKLGLDLRGGSHLLLELDVDKLDEKTDVKDALGRAIEIIRNRVDQFGVAEPNIVRQGDLWIAVQLPGITDPARAKELIGKTALLEFQLVGSEEDFRKINEKRIELEKSFKELWDNDGNLDPQIAALVPDDSAIFPGKDDQYFLLKSSVSLTGATLIDAKVAFGQGTMGGFPHVSLEFNSEGAKIFARVTGDNVGKNLAIVLDGVVQSAPVIRSRIPNGQAIIEGQFTGEEAKLLATILKAGALPAPVRVIEERTVGPSLGEDSINAGIKSILLGGLAVLLFMIFYYKLSGIVADIAIVLDLIILAGAMAYFHFTLTLPGIAGIILTVGMAVDANVLIFERIREELFA